MTRRRPTRSGKQWRLRTLLALAACAGALGLGVAGGCAPDEAAQAQQTLAVVRQDLEALDTAERETALLEGLLAELAQQRATDAEVRDPRDSRRLTVSDEPRLMHELSEQRARAESAEARVIARLTDSPTLAAPEAQTALRDRYLKGRCAVVEALVRRLARARRAAADAPPEQATPAAAAVQRRQARLMADELEAEIGRRLTRLLATFPDVVRTRQLDTRVVRPLYVRLGALMHPDSGSSRKLAPETQAVVRAELRRMKRLFPRSHWTRKAESLVIRTTAPTELSALWGWPAVLVSLVVLLIAVEFGRCLRAFLSVRRAELPHESAVLRPVAAALAVAPALRLGGPVTPPPGVLARVSPLPAVPSLLRSDDGARPGRAAERSASAESPAERPAEPPEGAPHRSAAAQAHAARNDAAAAPDAGPDAAPPSPPGGTAPDPPGSA